MLALAVTLATTNAAPAWHCKTRGYPMQMGYAPMMPMAFPQAGFAPVGGFGGGFGGGMAFNMSMQGDGSLAALALPFLGRLLGAVVDTPLTGNASRDALVALQNLIKQMPKDMATELTTNPAVAKLINDAVDKAINKGKPGTTANPNAESTAIRTTPSAEVVQSQKELNTFLAGIAARGESVSKASQISSKNPKTELNQLLSDIAARKTIKPVIASVTLADSGK
jgi:hypothetical protein